MTARSDWSAGQRLASDQLNALSDAASGAVDVLNETLADDGGLVVEVALDLYALPHAPGGIRVRPRERFKIYVPVPFPFKLPSVYVTHARWAGTPHVQWGNHLCLYAAPSTEWAPGDGMRGFVDRLRLWLEKASLGELDPDGQPLHPPAIYHSEDAGVVVVRSDIGDHAPWRAEGSGGPVALVGLCEQSGYRLDVVRWMQAGAYRATLQLESPPADEHGVPYVAAAAVVIEREISFEYPRTARALVEGLTAAGVDEADLLELLAVVADGNAMTAPSRGVPPVGENEEHPHGPGGAPLFLMVGTPSRRLAEGPRLAHLAAWRIRDAGDKITALLGDIRPGRSEALDELRERVLSLGRDWLAAARVAWARVFEDRAEVTVRRDAVSPAAWLRGKRVLVLGCGALGGPVAELCVRAGASRTVVVDRGVVTPGILVRQPYSDSDIGESKAAALARRLAGIGPGGDVRGLSADAITAILLPTLPVPEFDLVVDATADASVRAALEHARLGSADEWPPVLTMLVGHTARRGVVAVSSTGATGAGYDVLRRLGIAVRTTHAQEFPDVALDLFPSGPRTELFMPEPGCSAPTFVGSGAEATALAAGLFSAGLDALAGQVPELSGQPMAAGVVRLDLADPAGTRGRGTTGWIAWPNDAVLPGADGGMPVRISPAALTAVRAEARRAARMHGPRIETGGMLLGQIDEAVGAVFVDVATRPTPDSRLSARYFEHGTVGAQDTVRYHRERTNGATGFVGMWHTHPHGSEQPSPIDEASMASLVTPVAGGTSRALILIFGGEDAAWAGWRDDPGGATRVLPAVYARLVHRANRDGPPAPPVPPPPGDYHPAGWSPPGPAAPPAVAVAPAPEGRGAVTGPTVGLTLSGGGFRATAFGLGCLRALHDTGALDKVTVVSGVSGGSLLAALWAYGPDSFSDFDALTCRLLRHGLQRDLALRVISPGGIARSAASAVGSALPAKGRSERPYNRTDALRALLAERAFGDRLVSQPTRTGVATVINATDLITSRAVRFGSVNSSSSQHGTITDAVTVAEAVAASAAFPLLLPAVERTYAFERNGTLRRPQVNLTDGGVYDNLGLSVLDPTRSPNHTRHVYRADYVIACDAGRQEKGRSGARLLPFRLKRSFDITYRKTQDAGRGGLHAAGASGQIDGFVHAYLGQKDGVLPMPVADLVPLHRVNDYPTNFRAMTPADLDAVATRGEQLVRALLAHYCPRLV